MAIRLLAHPLLSTMVVDWFATQTASSGVMLRVDSWSFVVIAVRGILDSFRRTNLKIAMYFRLRTLTYRTVQIISWILCHVVFFSFHKFHANSTVQFFTTDQSIITRCLGVSIKKSNDIFLFNEPFCSPPYVFFSKSSYDHTVENVSIMEYFATA